LSSASHCAVRSAAAANALRASSSVL
jgi:hypothetical protein